MLQVPITYSNLVAIAAWRDPVFAASTINIDNIATGAPSVLDGVNLAANKRILVKDQLDQKQNGLYTVSVLGTGANGQWARTYDGSSSRLRSMVMTRVEDGVQNKGKLFFLNVSPPITVGVTNIVWTEHNIGGVPPDGSITNAKLADLAVTGRKLDLRREVRSGSISSTWQLSAVPVDDAHVLLFHNTGIMAEGALNDFTRANDVVTFNFAIAATDVVVAVYLPT